MDLGLAGKKAFLAGSSGGLGLAIAAALAADGCQVVINGRDPARLKETARTIQKRSGQAVGLAAGDVAAAGAAIKLVNQAADQLGGLDLLVTNSGGPSAGKFDDLAEEDWEKGVNLVFLSHLRLIRAALPYLRESTAPSVLTVTSYSVKQPIPNLMLSNSIRGATVGLTKSLALELGPEGIRFNSLLPGWTRTGRVLELMGFRAEENGTTIDAEIAAIAREIPLGRMAEPEEIGRVGAFLLSPAASYLTGVMLNVDGGIVKGVL